MVYCADIHMMFYLFYFNFISNFEFFSFSLLNVYRLTKQQQQIVLYACVRCCLVVCLKFACFICFNMSVCQTFIRNKSIKIIRQHHTKAHPVSFNYHYMNIQITNIFLVRKSSRRKDENEGKVNIPRKSLLNGQLSTVVVFLYLFIVLGGGILICLSFDANGKIKFLFFTIFCLCF